MASLEPDDLELLRGENYAWFVTLDPDGSPVGSITWVDADERHVLVNTAEERSTRPARPRRRAGVR
jgi:hypothetical protein